LSSNGKLNSPLSALSTTRPLPSRSTEESLAAFANSLKLGVTTLELDTHLASGGKTIVWHDDTSQSDKCRDTAPVAPGDVQFPYVGDRVAELSLAQIRTLDCGFMQLKGLPEQDVVEGNRIAELKDVFRLVRDAGARKVRFNIETKVEDGRSGGEGTAALTRAVVAEIHTAGMAERTTVQSFDWSSLNLTKKIAPELPLDLISPTFRSLTLVWEGALRRRRHIPGIHRTRQAP
jgi:glycerophosphoryl diester phosphodiesterase